MMQGIFQSPLKSMEKLLLVLIDLAGGLIRSESLKFCICVCLSREAQVLLSKLCLKPQVCGLRGKRDKQKLKAED